MIVFAESGLLIGFFLPGDSLLFTTGLLIVTDQLHMPLWLVCCWSCSPRLGDQVGYSSAGRWGRRSSSAPTPRFFKQENVEKAHEFFEKYGPKSLVLARFVPIVRTFTPIIAGVSRMHYRSFVTFNIIGGSSWGAGVTLLGAALGKVDLVHKHIETILVGPRAALGPPDRDRVPAEPPKELRRLARRLRRGRRHWRSLPCGEPPHGAGRALRIRRLRSSGAAPGRPWCSGWPWWPWWLWPGARCGGSRPRSGSGSCGSDASRALRYGDGHPLPLPPNVPHRRPRSAAAGPVRGGRGAAGPPGSAAGSVGSAEPAGWPGPARPPIGRTRHRGCSPRLRPRCRPHQPCSPTSPAPPAELLSFEQGGPPCSKSLNTPAAACSPSSPSPSISACATTPYCVSSPAGDEVGALFVPDREGGHASVSARNWTEVSPAGQQEVVDRQCACRLGCQPVPCAAAGQQRCGREQPGEEG